jgi:hypothetical protein
MAKVMNMHTPPHQQNEFKVAEKNVAASKGASIVTDEIAENNEAEKKEAASKGAIDIAWKSMSNLPTPDQLTKKDMKKILEIMEFLGEFLFASLASDTLDCDLPSDQPDYIKAALEYRIASVKFDWARAVLWLKLRHQSIAIKKEAAFRVLTMKKDPSFGWPDKEGVKFQTELGVMSDMTDEVNKLIELKGGIFVSKTYF